MMRTLPAPLIRRSSGLCWTCTVHDEQEAAMRRLACMKSVFHHDWRRRGRISSGNTLFSWNGIEEYWQTGFRGRSLWSGLAPSHAMTTQGKLFHIHSNREYRPNRIRSTNDQAHLVVPIAEINEDPIPTNLAGVQLRS